MHDEPDWLEIDEYLYPSTLMQKIIKINSPSLAHPVEISVSLIYNSYNREIEFADTLSQIINQCS